MKLELFKNAMIKEDIRKYKLKKGDIVTLVDYFEAHENRPAGFTIEVFNVHNETIGVYTIPISKLLPVPKEMVYTARKLKKAS